MWTVKGTGEERHLSKKTNSHKGHTEFWKGMEYLQEQTCVARNPAPSATRQTGARLGKALHSRRVWTPVPSSPRTPHVPTFSIWINYTMYLSFPKFPHLPVWTVNSPRYHSDLSSIKSHLDSWPSHLTPVLSVLHNVRLSQNTILTYYSLFKYCSDFLFSTKNIPTPSMRYKAFRDLSPPRFHALP